MKVMLLFFIIYLDDMYWFIKNIYLTYQTNITASSIILDSKLDTQPYNKHLSQSGIK